MVAQFLADPQSPFHGIAPIAGGKWSQHALPSLADGPRIYMATGYRDYLWPYARTQISAMATAGLAADRVEVRRTGGGHDLYAWHFDELWEFLDAGVRPGGGHGRCAVDRDDAALACRCQRARNRRQRLVAAGAHGRMWRHGSTGWTLELDRGDSGLHRAVLRRDGTASSAETRRRSRQRRRWGASDVGARLRHARRGWINGAACRDDGSIVVVGYWSAAQ